MVHALVLITADPEMIDDIGLSVVELDGVREVYTVAGDEDLVAILAVKNHENLAKIVTSRIAKTPGVVKTRTLTAFRVYRPSDLAEWGVGVD